MNPVIPGAAGLFGVAGFVVGGLFSLLVLVVAIGLIFLLVRFLIIGTQAAQLYITRNAPPLPPVVSAPSDVSVTEPMRPTPTFAPDPVVSAPIAQDSIVTDSAVLDDDGTSPTTPIVPVSRPLSKATTRTTRPKATLPSAALPTTSQPAAAPRAAPRTRAPKTPPTS